MISMISMIRPVATSGLIATDAFLNFLTNLDATPISNLRALSATWGQLPAAPAPVEKSARRPPKWMNEMASILRYIAHSLQNFYSQGKHSTRVHII